MKSKNIDWVELYVVKDGKEQMIGKKTGSGSARQKFESLDMEGELENCQDYGYFFKGEKVSLMKKHAKGGNILENAKTTLEHYKKYGWVKCKTFSEEEYFTDYIPKDSYDITPNPNNDKEVFYFNPNKVVFFKNKFIPKSKKLAQGGNLSEDLCYSIGGL